MWKLVSTKHGLATLFVKKAIYAVELLLVVFVSSVSNSGVPLADTWRGIPSKASRCFLAQNRRSYLCPWIKRQYFNNTTELCRDEYTNRENYNLHTGCPVDFVCSRYNYIWTTLIRNMRQPEPLKMLIRCTTAWVKISQDWHSVFRKNCVFSQFTATPPSPTSLKRPSKISTQCECTVTPIGS